MMVTSLALALVLGWQVAQGITTTSVQDSERLARDGRTREAIAQFERVVADRPDDLDARVSLARLRMRFGDPQLGEQEFRAVLLQDPTRVDALVGLADALCSQGLVALAAEPLDTAERLAPHSAEVLASRGRALLLAGRLTDAERYYSQARSSSPADPDIDQRFQQIQRINRHRVEGSFQHEHFAGGSDAYTGDIGADIRTTDRVRIGVRAQGQNRYSRQEARFGGGVEFRARPNLTLRGWSLFGPGAELIARTDTTIDIEQTRGRTEIGVGLRYLTFAPARVWILAPTATVWFNDRTSVTARYYASTTTISEHPAALHHSALARLRRNVHPRVWLDLGYSRGYESIDTLSTDQLGSFRADTVSAGILCHLNGLNSIATSVEYQRQSDARTLVRLTAAVTRRF
jgi:YaiO family outer membrane protein